MMPFSNTVDIITLSGKDLKSVLEDSANRLAIVEGEDGNLTIEGKGGFLQVSGMLLSTIVSSVFAGVMFFITLRQGIC